VCEREIEREREREYSVGKECVSQCDDIIDAHEVCDCCFPDFLCFINGDQMF